MRHILCLLTQRCISNFKLTIESMKPFRLIISLLLAIFTTQAFAQDGGIEKVDVSNSASKHRIGFAGGTSGGAGVMYAFKPNKFQVQAVAFPNVRPNNAYLQTGLSFMYDVKKYKYFDLFAYENNRLIYEKHTYTWGYYDVNGVYTSAVEKNESIKISHSLGMGLRFTFLQHLGAQIMTGFASYNYNQLSMSIDGGLYFIL